LEANSVDKKQAFPEIRDKGSLLSVGGRRSCSHDPEKPSMRDILKTPAFR